MDLFNHIHIYIFIFDINLTNYRYDTISSLYLSYSLNMPNMKKIFRFSNVIYIPLYLYPFLIWKSLNIIINTISCEWPAIIARCERTHSNMEEIVFLHCNLCDKKPRGWEKWKNFLIPTSRAQRVRDNLSRMQLNVIRPNTIVSDVVIARSLTAASLSLAAENLLWISCDTPITMW